MTTLARRFARWPWLRAAVWAAVLVGGALLGMFALRQLTIPLALAQRLPDAGVAAPAGPKPLSPKVKITFQTVPVLKGVKVEIKWGKKRLGFIDGPRKPFILERMRDSGPIDVTVKAEGYLTVNTRAYTFDDNKVFVKMTPIEEKHTLLGYRIQLPDAGVDGGVTDGGVSATADGGLPPPLPVPLGPAPPPPVQGPLPPPPPPQPAP